MLCRNKPRQKFYRWCQAFSRLPGSWFALCLYWRSPKLKPQTRYLLAFLLLSLVSGSVYFHLTGGLRSWRISLWRAVENTFAARFLRQTVGQRGFLLDNPNCPIPNIDPFSHISSLNLGNAQTIVCSGRPALILVTGSSLRIIWTSVAKVFGLDFHHCEYQPFTRSSEPYTDFYIQYYPMIRTFVSDVSISDVFDYVKVTCFDRRNQIQVTEYHSLVHNKSDLKIDSHGAGQQKAKETYNVYLLGVDSLSRLNMIRLMPKTRRYLFDHLHAFELPGYSKLGDNTFPNMVPFLTGYSPEELDWNESVRLEYRFEDFPFIWKNFSREGYQTMYAEDDPAISIFNYNKLGFLVPPADFYNRPQMLAMYQDQSIWSSEHCIGDTLETSQLLRQISHFAEVFRTRPHFVFTFITRLTHDSAGLLATADDAYFNFFQSFHAQGHLNRSILIFFSDHGNRFGSLRDTYFGKYEERMPMFFIVLPPSFRRKYPQLVKNVQTNAHRLTTPFDVHATLLDILYFQGKDKKVGTPSDRGLSLLREIPAGRTCSNASIQPHWCLCWVHQKLDPNSTIATKIGHGVVRVINKLLAPTSGPCAVLTLHLLTELVKMEVNEELLLYHHIEDDRLEGQRSEAAILYQVSLTTTPGMARFEATVTFDPDTGKLELAGDISRTNRYYNQSDCVNRPSLKKFCYCLE